MIYEQMPYKTLRQALHEYDIDQNYLARKLLRSTAYVSLCMRGRREWKLNECYQIMDIIKQPYSMIPVYFPKDGFEAA